MSKAHSPEMKKYMSKRLMLKLNGERIISGILRGFDPFMNLVLEDAVECKNNNKTHNIGTVLVRGNNIVMLETLDRA